MVTMIVIQQKGTQMTLQSLQNSALKYDILQVLKNTNTCKCQFAGKDFRKKEVALSDFKSNCGTSAEVLLKSGEPIDKGLLVVDSIKVSNIAKTGSNTIGFIGFTSKSTMDKNPATGYNLSNIEERQEYSGNFVVNYRPTKFRPLGIQIPMQFMVSRTGTLLECGADTDQTVELRRIRLDLSYRHRQQRMDMDTLEGRLGGHDHPEHQHISSYSGHGHNKNNQASPPYSRRTTNTPAVTTGTPSP